MSLIQAAVRTTETTTKPTVGIYAGAKGCRVLTVSCVQVAATAQSIGLIRGTSVGTATSPVTFERFDANDPAATSTLVISWSVLPTLDTTYMRRWNSGAVAGVGVVWSFPRTVSLVASSNPLLVNNLATNAAMDVSVLAEES